MRALLGGDPNAAAWIDRASARSVEGLVPDLVFAEVANTLVVHVRAGVLNRRQARARIRAARALPLEVVSTGVLAETAVDVALNRDLSVYDASYAALAEASEAILVTADRRLAAAVPRSALLPGAAPPG